MTMQEMTQVLLVAIIGSSGLWSFLTIIMQRRMEHRLKDNTANKLRDDALLAILHQIIYQTCERYIMRGCITSDELATLVSMYTPYEKMGGNGTGHIMMERVKKLELVTEEERMRRLNSRMLHDLSEASLAVGRNKNNAMEEA